MTEKTRLVLIQLCREALAGPLGYWEREAVKRRLAALEEAA